MMGMSLEELSDRSELTRKTISLIERGIRKHIKPATHKKLVAALGRSESFYKTDTFEGVDNSVAER
jgi:transcriptional regulator with XRE-family HTH domain